tara:strand:+ start:1941 stop:2939 length:999 start_codon:yes stop_codon:yes gene_type:complete
MNNSKLIKTDYIIVGSGLSGLTIANILSKNGLKTIVVDKGRKAGGRMSHGVMNRSEVGGNEFKYDHGAQFFTARSDEFKKEVDFWLENKWIKKWCNGFSKNDGYPRYIGINGMHSLPLKISENLNVFQNTTIKTLKLLKNDWFLEGSDNINFSSKYLIMTPPLLQTIKLLSKHIYLFDKNFLEQIKNINYHKCISLMMSVKKETNIKFPGAMQKPNSFWDFVTDNKLKGISKKNCITAHASASFSDFIWEFNDEKCKNIMIDELAKLVNFDKIETKIHKWKYAKPKQVFNYFFKQAIHNQNLIITGEIFGGAKVEGAFLSGFNTANYLVKNR